MGVDFEKCESCHECLNTQCFPNCFCCEDLIDHSCSYCLPDYNCVDDEHEYYMCDNCIQCGTDDENYYVKNVKKIMKQVKKLRKTHFNKKERLKNYKQKKSDI